MYKFNAKKTVYYIKMNKYIVTKNAVWLLQKS